MIVPLDPLVVLISDPGEPSPAAARLRAGGYLVTKTFAADARATIDALAPQAVVVDLPALEALRFVKTLEDVEPPLLVVTSAPRLVESICRAMHRRDVDGEVICAVDRLIADAA